MQTQPRLVALLGDPVHHSLSPRIQNAAFRAAGVAGVYVALRTPPEDLPGLLRGVAGSGGCGNVTLPYKEAAARVVDRRTPAAERTGAVNTFWLEDGQVHGDNTDVIGVRRALDTLLAERLAGAGSGFDSVSGSPIGGRHALLLGAGGAARAVLVALEEAGIASVRIRNRTRPRAVALVQEMSPFSMPVRVENVDGTVDAASDGPVSLVINATRLGLGKDDAPPLAVDRLPPGAAILDLVYHPEETRWVREARAAGHRAADGGLMLVEQGMAAFERWWGQPAPRGAFLRELASVRAEAGGQ